MSKLVFSLILACLVVASKAEAQASTKLSVVEDGATVLGLNGKPRSVQKTSLPPDDGRSNWGDEVFKARQSEDVLLLRDLVVYPKVSTRDQTLKYTASFNNVRSITSVRFVNVGRERAFAGDIDVGSDEVEVYFTLPAQTDPRVLIEVYGYMN